MRKVFFVLAIIILYSLCFAQSESSTVATSSAYVYSGPSGTVDQLKIYTYIWGQVRSPGLYLVPDNTDLLTLISLAGGPNENAKMSRVRIVRQTENGEKIIWVDLRDYIETAEQDLIPIMMPGDTVILSGSTFYAFSRVADFLSKVVIVLSVYNMIANISK
ncbi:MAG: SLBB domain-containing protein [Candidatus Cloacimonas sp.]|nr:SLBB domain-containing protein [Candidatus Cloacimonadota bacterium]